MQPIINKYLLEEDTVEDTNIKLHNPDDDGITHINIWYLGKTELGRMLSSFYELPFKHPFFGDFKTMEGLWRYVQNKDTTSEEEARGVEKDKLRYMKGMAAKNFGRSLKWHKVDYFKEIIAAANFYKIEQSTKLMKMFTESTLPFAMYYVHSTTGDAEGQEGPVVNLTNYNWLVKSFEDNRILMQCNERPNKIDYSQFSKK